MRVFFFFYSPCDSVIHFELTFLSRRVYLLARPVVPAATASATASVPVLVFLTLFLQDKDEDAFNIEVRICWRKEGRKDRRMEGKKKRENVGLV